MDSPLVSIIIPTYNRAHLIGETLDSILAQTYTNWECIIVDDGSTDNTEEVIKEYIQKDARFQYHHRPDTYKRGGNGARNYGFLLSKGIYIKWFDSDDVMFSFFLETQVTVMEEKSSFDFCICQWKYLYSISHKVKHEINLKPKNHPIYSYFLENHVFATPSVLWKKSFLNGKELFDENLRRSQEADFHFRMLTYNPNYVMMKDYLFMVRREISHKSIDSESNNRMAKESVLLYFKKSFSIVKILKFDKKEIVLKYLIFRYILQWYILVSESESFYDRLKHFNGLSFFWNALPLLKGKRVWVLLGFFSMLFFKKGYKLLWLKEFDFRDISYIKK